MTQGQSRNPLSSDEYARLVGFDGSWRDTWWERDFLELIAKRCGFDHVKAVLDVGCGVGHWSRTLSQILPSNVRIAGIDIEGDFVDRAIKLARVFGLLDADYRVGAAEALPYKDDSFDLATCQTVLIHVKDPMPVLNEMRRVLRPGGTLLVAEPDNLVESLSWLTAEPRPEWSVIRRQLDFYYTCLLGKKALGMGDSAVGERLPAMIVKAGFDEMRVCINEKCAVLVPPYDAGSQKIECEFFTSLLKSDVLLGCGPRECSYGFFTAASGNDADFDVLWKEAMENQQRMLRAIENKTYSGGRASVMYVISAKKPRPLA